MEFSFLEDIHEKWDDILVIGKTIERDGKKYHIIGMTLSDEAKLYILEPHMESKKISLKGVRNMRRIIKEQGGSTCCYLHCSDFYLGEERLQTQGGQGGPLLYSAEDCGLIQLFFDMMSAGWTVPEWLREEDWENLQLVTLHLDEMERLPKYSPQMPITIKHKPEPVRHILEKPVTLHVGKNRSFSFTDSYGDEVWCYINNVTLVDVWENTKEQLNDAETTDKFSPEQLEQVSRYMYEALEQNCPKGMCYVSVEYECSKDLNLIFYAKQYLQSRPETHRGSSAYLITGEKLDKETGTHNLPLHGCMIQTPVSPDTDKIAAELFSYFEMMDEWTETVV
ncbi:MAG: hypothetical protein NC321_05120 [Clostridium sp.]|nr:hypothetical protein [Clostridium sp.]